MVGVSVTSDDENLESFGLGLRGDGCDHVISLVPVCLKDGNVERGKYFLNEGDLPLELIWRLGPCRLVFGEGLRAKGLPGHVEGDRNMCRLLITQTVDQHRGKAVHRIRWLPRGRREVLHREGIEGAVRQ